MKLKYQFVINEVADKMVAVAVDSDEFNGMVKLNKTGAFIFEILKNDVTEDEIVAEMIKKYDATEEQLKETVHNFIESMKEKNIIE